MTASLPEDVQAVFDRFITTELTTVDRRGQPITWPVTPYYTPGGPCISLTTGLGYPKKANDARANPMVALLFSDPTGCGLDDPPMVLVQGSADVDDREPLSWPQPERRRLLAVERAQARSEELDLAGLQAAPLRAKMDQIHPGLARSGVGQRPQMRRPQ